MKRAQVQKQINYGQDTEKKRVSYKDREKERGGKARGEREREEEKEKKGERGKEGRRD